MNVRTVALLALIGTLYVLPALVYAVKLRDDDDGVKFLKDTEGEEKSFVFAAAEMDEFPPEPIVDGQPKSKWPELLGKTADEAKQVIEREAPGFKIQVIAAGQMATMDFRTNRIRIWLGEGDRVARPPMIG